MFLHSFSLNSQILIAANKDLDLRSVQDLRYSGHCFDTRYFLSDFFFSHLLVLCVFW